MSFQVKFFAFVLAISPFLAPSVSHAASAVKKVPRVNVVRQVGQNSPPNRVPLQASAEATAELANRLEILAKQNKVVFLVEGTPLRKFSGMSGANEANPEPIDTSPF